MWKDLEFKRLFFFFLIPKVISIELHVHHAMTVGKLLHFFLFIIFNLKSYFESENSYYLSLYVM